ncbi:MAG: hypothetical protein ABIU29_07205 [Chthoniobacterales bacterium]
MIVAGLALAPTTVVITGLAFTAIDAGATVVITATAMAAMVITGLTFAAGNSGASALVVATAMPSVIIAGFALAASNSDAAALVVATAVAAVVVTRFTLTCGRSAITAPVITRFAMAPAAIVARLPLARHGAECTIIIAVTTFATTAAIVAAADPGRGLIATALVIVLVPATHIPGAACLRHGAAAAILMDGPSIHAAVAPAHAHAGETPVAPFAGAAGEKC